MSEPQSKSTPGGQLIPPPQFAPPSIKHLSVGEKIRLWAQMVDEGDQMVMAGLRRQLGPDATEADVHQAFLEWLERRNAEHDQMIVQMITNLRRRERESGQ